MENKLDQTEDDTATDEPDESGVDEGMDCQAVEPDIPRPVFAARDAAQIGMAIFAHGEKFPLERKIRQGMREYQRPKENQRVLPLRKIRPEEVEVGKVEQKIHRGGERLIRGADAEAGSRPGSCPALK